MTGVIIIFVASYLLGAIPTGLIISKLVGGKDIREYGSGNIGAANVARVLGKKWGLITFALDFLKGAIPTIIARYFMGLSLFVVCMVGFTAILGHVFSIFLKGRGGKGVATAAGLFFVISPVSLLFATAVYGALLGITHISSVGSFAAAGALILAMIFLEESFIKIIFGLAALALLIYTHRENIFRLIRGKENRF